MRSATADQEPSLSRRAGWSRRCLLVRPGTLEPAAGLLPQPHSQFWAVISRHCDPHTLTLIYPWGHWQPVGNGRQRSAAVRGGGTRASEPLRRLGGEHHVVERRPAALAPRGGGRHAAASPLAPPRDRGGLPGRPDL